MRREMLVQLRRSREWLQKDVVREIAQRYGFSITESYYGMIEQGVRTPRLDLALAIAKLFEREPAEVFFAQISNEVLGHEHTA